MGITYTSYVVAGVEIEYLYDTTKIRGCEHGLPLLVQPVSFCPTCGQPAWKENKVPIKGYDKKEDTICGLRITRCTSRYRGKPPHCYDDGGRIFVGEELQRCGGEGKNDKDANKFFLSNSELEKIKIRIKAALMPVGLWNEEKFGIWIIQRGC